MNTLRLDPTRTTLLRKSYMKEMRRRFLSLLKKVVEAIGELDVLGLEDSQPIAFNQAVLNQMPSKQAWRFLTDAQKLDAFNVWFDEMVEAEILQVDYKGEPWMAKYVYSAYKKGSLRAYIDSHKKQMLEKMDFYQGKRAQFLESAFNQPERLSKLQFLYTRSYEELKGITSSMSQQIGRILADGIATGRSPRTLATDLAKGITGITKKRALVMARTEIIAAHAEGQLDAFEEMGIQDIAVMAEWSTAGDDRVCEECATLDAVVMTVEEARGLLPRHPNCRCAWIPANVGETAEGRRYWTKAQKLTRINKSLMAGLPKRTRAGEVVPQTVEEVRVRSSWLGKEVELGKGVLPSISPSSEMTMEEIAFSVGSNKAMLNVKARLAELSKKVPSLQKTVDSIRAIKYAEQTLVQKETVKRLYALEEEIANLYKVKENVAREVFEGLLQKAPGWEGNGYGLAFFDSTKGLPIPKQVSRELYLSKNPLWASFEKKLPKGWKVVGVKNSYSTTSQYGTVVDPTGKEYFVRIADHPGRMDLPGMVVKRLLQGKT